MAKKAEAPAATAPRATEQNESVYKADELARAAVKVFGVMPECVEAAFKNAGKTEATLAEAKRIVNDFMTREVS